MIKPNTPEPLVFQALDAAGEPVTSITASGLAVTVKIFNPTNGQIWDWASSAFSASPSQPTATMTEINASTLPGHFYRSWPGAAAGYYLVEYAPTAGLTAVDHPPPVELRVTPYALTTEVPAAAPTAAAIADAVLDEVLSDHVNAGTLGASLALLDVAVSTRATAAGVWATVTSNADWTYGECVELGRKHITNRLDVTAGNDGTLALYDDNGTTALVTQTLRDAAGGAILLPVGSPSLRGATT